VQTIQEDGKYKYTYYQNTHTNVKTPTHTKIHSLQNPHIHTSTHYKTHTYTHPHITKPIHTHPHIAKQVKTTTVQDTHQIK